MQAIDLELTNAEVEVRQLEARLRVVPMNDAQIPRAYSGDYPVHRWTDPD